MPSDRTFVTELATALGMTGPGDVATALATRPAALVDLRSEDWSRLDALWRSREYDADFGRAFENGVAFAAAPDALAGRRPRLIEWTGGRRPPGDEVVPADLRVDHVYLVSCKYLSRILHNPSPARLVDGLLAQSPVEDRRDWFERVAPDEHRALYRACLGALRAGQGDGRWSGHPEEPAAMTAAQRDQLSSALDAGWPCGAAADAYGQLSLVVSERTADRWRARTEAADPEVLLWRMLRIGAAPYFVVGAHRQGTMRLRICTPWDWRRLYRLRRFEVTAQLGGQARVGWAATYELRATGRRAVVAGHVEIRWSHGRFRQPPEAKVYLDSPHADVPGYLPLDTAGPPAAPSGADQLPLDG